MAKMTIVLTGDGFETWLFSQCCQSSVSDCCGLWLQELDNYNIKWQATSGVPGLQDIYLNLLPQLFAVSTGVPFMVQGTGQANLVNWGDGFVTDYSVINHYSLSDPNGFFQGIMSAPYLNQVTVPHDIVRQAMHLLYNRVQLHMPCPALLCAKRPGPPGPALLCRALPHAALPCPSCLV